MVGVIKNLEGTVVANSSGGFDVASAYNNSSTAMSNAQSAYSDLVNSVPGKVVVEAIGLGTSIDTTVLKQFDTDHTVATIDTAKLADAINRPRRPIPAPTPSPVVRVTTFCSAT